MQYKSFNLAAAVLLFVTISCNKQEQVLPNRCLPDAPIERTIVNVDASISLINNEYFIIEKNTIDTRLRPCDLPSEFKIDKLSVKVTGEVKRINQSSGEPCCTNNFVILKISK